MLRPPPVVVLALLAAVTPAQAAPRHGHRPASLEIRGAMVVRGDGSPPFGPTSVFVQDGLVVDGPIERPEVVLDASGCYVHPGFVNTHGHIQEQAAGIAVPPEYVLKLWLACGITTVRDNGGAYPRIARLRAKAASDEAVASPRLVIFRGFGTVHDVDEARARVRSFKDGGADGIKLWSNFAYDEDLLRAILTTADQVGLPTTAHIGVGRSNALTYARLGLDCVEHWYGIPDAAVDGVQAFPPDFSYSNELMRFRYAGRLWREADPERLRQVLAELVERGVAWSPTLAVYEAARDLQRAENKPWFADYLHPAFARFFEPNLANHGSFFVDWTSTDEVFWRENYAIWMGAVREFARLGGVVTTGEDAGYIWLMHGFGLLRELELHLEAGFHPLEVLSHATWNGARTLKLDQEIGLVRHGWHADLVVVDGNPLADLKVYRPGGARRSGDDGAIGHTDGIRWTIRDGRLWHAPTLLAEVRELVADARAHHGAK